MKTKIVIISIITLVIFSQNTYARSKSKVTGKICTGVDNKIRHMNSLLRSGYSLEKGEAWKKNLKELKQLKYSCNMKRYRTK